MVSSSSTPKVNNLSKSEALKSKSTEKRLQSFSQDITPTSTPPSTPPRELKVRFLIDEDDNNHHLDSARSKNLSLKKASKSKSSHSDDMLESSFDHDIPKLSRKTSSSTFDFEGLSDVGNASPFRSCIQSFISSKNKTQRGRKLSISSYDDVYSSSKVDHRSVVPGTRGNLKESSYQRRNDSYSDAYNSRINGNIDRAEI